MNEELLLWNVLDRSQGGHERRRRVLWPMTSSEAREWSEANRVRIEQVGAGNGPQAELNSQSD
jgi:hypothetical protein